ncbi:hypothetical protein OIU76_027422 [Salix suchowensis]|nr:hypothetical protein OIU76_027422 [Salix suchowensis]
MDGGGDIYRVSSARLSSSSNIWRNSTMEVFSRSSRDEDDEEALKWAALEKLPSFLRMRRGILTEEKGQAREIDVANLGLIEKRNLLERLVKISEEDNERFLLKLKERIHRYWILKPQIHPKLDWIYQQLKSGFEHLSIEAEAYVGGRALPTIFNFSANMLEGFLSFLHILPSRKQPFPILHDLSGIIKPRRMTLLLGPPSSGKTTLLLALAGKLGKDLKSSGSVTYNGHEMAEFVPQRTSAYISQHDLHIGEMTVRETLSFSARCQGVGPRYEMLTELSRREREANIKPDPDIDIFMKAAALEGQETNVTTDYILKILGLEICADTMVGDEMIRGISGGQKKRVTTGEMLVGPARAFFMDEISTGLDSSTTFQIVNSLRQTTHILNGTTFISLLQPAPETYDLFDDIILLSEGLIVYQGPCENVLEFFESMGFKCPERKGVADFLQEVTSRKDQEQYWARRDQPYSFVSAKEFSEAFQSFHIGRKLGTPESLHLKRIFAHEKELVCLHFQIHTTYYLSFHNNDSISKNGDASQYNSGWWDLSRRSFLCYHCHHVQWLLELAMTIMKLPVFYKQRDLLFYPPWAYAIPTWILKIPITFVEVAIWTIMTYYVIGFDPNIGRFFKQYLIFVLTNQMSSGLFRMTGALGRNIIVANTFGSFALLAVLVMGGFILSRDNVKPWWIWGYWFSPLMYVQNAVSVNEFLGNSWRHIPPNSTESFRGALIGYTLLFNFLFTLALKYLNPFGKPQAMLSKEALAEKNANRNGEVIELSTRGKSSSVRGNDSRISSSPRPPSSRIPSFGDGQSN